MKKQPASRGTGTVWDDVQRKIDKQDFDDAIAQLSDLIAKNDHQDFAYGLRAECWLLLNKTDRAMGDAQKAIALNRDSLVGWVISGLCQMRLNDAPSAIAAFNEAVRIEPNSIDARLNRGLCYMSVGKVQDGIADEDVLIGQDPNFFDPYWYRVQGNAALKNWQAVKSDGEKMIQIQRNRPEGHLATAIGLENLGNGYNAVPEYQKAAASYRAFQIQDKLDGVLNVLADLIPQYDFGKSNIRVPSRDVREDHHAIPADVKSQLFVMETLAPQMRPKPGLIKEKAKARWMIGRTWAPGTTIKVAFNGGSPEFQKLVADTASEWSQYGNVRFDFGFNPSTGTYRQWSSSDTSADIRVGFLENDGHWSIIGIDSKTVRPEDPRSMNLALTIESPERRKTVILHEFGHALGFGHEHQHPNGACDDEIKWEDDPNYKVTWRFAGGRPDNIMYVADADGNKPGIYSLLVGGMNQWIPQQVDFQMRQLSQQSAFEQGFKLGPVDRKSIMHYSFMPAFFKKGADSPCCITEASDISQLDKDGLAKFYPPTASSK